MKKNYIAPSTVAATWGSMGLMQTPSIVFGTNNVSGVTTQATTDDVNLID